MTTATLQKITTKVIPIAKEHGIEYVALFGSRARGDAKKNSDFDFLVRFAQPVSLLKVIRAERQLAKSLKHRVDLVTEGAVNPLLKDSILSDIKVIYEEK